MGEGKDPIQRQATAESGQFEQEGEMMRSAMPPAQLFADGDDGGASNGPNGGAGGGAGETPVGGDDGLPGTLEELLVQVQHQVGEGQDEMEQAAAPGQQGAEAETQDPPHEFVQVNDRSNNRISDAVVGELNTAIDLVRSYTGQDMGVNFGDTTRRLSQGTTKVGADNFSWHKSGRAVDFNQGLPWLIMEDPAGESMYFRLYLAANEAGAASPYAVTLTQETAGTVHYDGLSGPNFGVPLIDVTAILEANGFERIPAHTGWENSYNKREWWHYVNDGGLTWYQALREIYTDAEIVTAIQALTQTGVQRTRHVTAGRLGRREGFPSATLRAIWGNTPITLGNLSLHFSVGNERNCANIPEDVAAVRTKLTGLGIANDPDISVMISAYQQSRTGSSDGWMQVGGGTHRRLGAEAAP